MPQPTKHPSKRASRRLAPFPSEANLARLYPLGCVTERVSQVGEQSTRDFFTVGIRR